MLLQMYTAAISLPILATVVEFLIHCVLVGCRGVCPSIVSAEKKK
jgi:hypothetical protein